MSWDEKERRMNQEVLKNEMDHLNQKVDKLEQNQEKMISEMQRYRGMWGGIMLVVTAIIAALTIYLEYFKKGGS